MSCMAWPNQLPRWVTIVRGEPERLTNLTQLAPQDKKTLWREIRTQRPALAALLKDPNLHALREAFDADICSEEGAGP